MASKTTTQASDYLATEKLGKLMRQYSIPCIISLLVGALYNIVDQIFIANASYLGSYGNAANTVVFPLTMIALAIATMVGDGCCAFVSIRLGEKETDQAHQDVGSSMIFVIVVSIILMGVYLIFQDPILTAFGGRVNDQTFAYAKEYFTWISIGIPFYMFGQAMNPVIRSDGSPRFAMISLLIGSILNCFLDPLFIFVFKWGMMGAAVATVAGQIVGAVTAVWYFFHTKIIKLSKDSFHFRWSLLKVSLPLGFTSFLTQFSVVLSMAAVNDMIVKCVATDPVFSDPSLSQIPTAVVGIVMKFFQIVMSIAIGMAAGIIPVVGYNIGAGRKDRARDLMVMLMKTEFIVGLCFLALFEIFPRQLIGLFGAANESVHYTNFGIRCIRIFLCMIALSCVNKGMTVYLQAIGKPKESAIISTLREVVFGVGLPILLPIFLGLDGILLFMPIADIITFFVTIYIARKTYRELSDDSSGAKKTVEIDTNKTVENVAK
ncbi:MAG: MATE family efflux transporter [Bilifractor sp.]|jgi:putative MATE family efflux protein